MLEVFPPYLLPERSKTQDWGEGRQGESPRNVSTPVLGKGWNEEALLFEEQKA